MGNPGALISNETEHSLGTPGITAASGAHYFPTTVSTNSGLLPPAGITNDASSSPSKYSGFGASEMLERSTIHHNMTQPISPHKRMFSNTSLRGDYSLSNVTMDDLDTHFGS